MLITRLLSLLGILSIVFTLNGCAASNIAYHNLTGPQLATATSDETVALVTDFGSLDRQHNAFCSAVWVGRKTILTANHCVEGYADMLTDMERVKALLANGVPPDMAISLVHHGLQKVPAEDLKDLPDMLQELAALVRGVPAVNPDSVNIPFIVQGEVVDIGVPPSAIHTTAVLARSGANDLAVLEVVGYIPDHTIAQLAIATPAVGSLVSVVGHPYHNYWTYRQGVVSAYRHDMTHDGFGEDDDKLQRLHTGLMQISAEVKPGDSGGGVFDVHGDLVGINIFINDQLAGAYCVPLETIRGFLAGQHIVNLTLVDSKKDPSL